MLVGGPSLYIYSKESLNNAFFLDFSTFSLPGGYEMLPPDAASLYVDPPDTPDGEVLVILGTFDNYWEKSACVGYAGLIWTWTVLVH